MTQSNISFLIEQMKQPEFYPHPVTEPITLIQTHVSYVLLTGEYAYKIKKAVDFGFLNYSTLSLRQHFCQEEIRLNGAIAPEIYLEILPIIQTGDRFILNAEGEPVEYAIKMRQFPQESLLSNMFKQGKLTESHMQELGRVVAQFHAQTETNEHISSFGTADQVRLAFDENYEQTEKYIGIAQTQEQFNETKQKSDDFFASQQEVLKNRQINSKIRECHGDLHLGNICLWGDRIQLFDRIEFNDSFRYVDVMYDIAFTVMDLDAKGRKDFANIFLNAYLERTGDWEGLQVLTLYLSRQAYVRAKVTSFLLDDPAIADEQKQEAAKIAADYYRLAWEYTQSQKGRLILMSGLSGSGKTTVARQIAKQIGAIHIRSDAARKHLAGIPIDERGEDWLYTSEMSQKTYARLLELGVMLANKGFSVILDAKYDRHIWREEAIAAAKRNGLPLSIFECTAPIEVLKERVVERTTDISDATVDLLDRQLATAEPFNEIETAYLTQIDTTQPDWIERLNLKDC
jgi:uncharacterized protein